MSTGILERFGRALRQLWQPVATCPTFSPQHAWRIWEHTVASCLPALPSVAGGMTHQEAVAAIAAALWDPAHVEGAGLTVSVAKRARAFGHAPSTEQPTPADATIPTGVPWPPSAACARRIAAALAALPTRHRRVLRLREEDRHSLEEIAALLGYQRTTTVRALLARAAWVRGEAIAECWRA